MPAGRPLWKLWLAAAGPNDKEGRLVTDGVGADHQRNAVLGGHVLKAAQVLLVAGTDVDSVDIVGHTAVEEASLVGGEDGLPWG